MLVRNIICPCLLLMLCFSLPRTNAQTLSAESIKQLKAYEDTLQALGQLVLGTDSSAKRTKACYAMIPKLVAALKITGSFHYHFDSLETMSILYPKDSTFRIFNWYLPRANGSYRYFGAIQKNNPNKLELIPLYDRSDSLFRPADTVLTNNTWYGALYYNIYPVKVKGQTYYMLFGLDGYDLVSTRKLLDVLYFDKEGKPKFGAPIFYFGENEQQNRIKRFILEYRKDATISLNYSEDYKKIIFDHLVATSEKTADLKFTYMPDGGYDGFEWKNNRWEFIDNVFKDVVDDKKDTPVPMPKGSHDMTKPRQK